MPWWCLITFSNYWLTVFSFCLLNISRLRQNGSHSADNIFKHIFLNENIWISMKISLYACHQTNDDIIWSNGNLDYLSMSASPGFNELTFEVLHRFKRSYWPFWITICLKNVTHNHWKPKKISRFIDLSWEFITVLADGLAHKGTRAFTVLVVTNYGTGTYEWCLPYGNINLGQHWLLYWLVAWWHQAITWTYVDLSSARSIDIHWGQFCRSYFNHSAWKLVM